MLVILVVMVYVTYPGITEVDTVELFLGMYTSFLVFILLIVTPYLLEGVKSEKGLLVFTAVAMALSVAARNLRRRGLRTALALFSVIALSLAVSSLSSMSYYATTKELVTTVKAQGSADNFLMVFSKHSLTFDDIIYVFSQPETLEAGFILSSVPRLEPYGYHATRTIRAFIAVHGYSPIRSELSKIVQPLAAIEELSQRSDTVLVSSAWRDTGVQLGDIVDLAGIKLKVVGFYDSKTLSSIKDVGGYDILPLSTRPDGAVEPVHPDEMVIIAPEVAIRLGGFTKRIYAKTGSDRELLNLAKRLSTQEEYIAVAKPADGYIRIYFPGFTVEFRGNEAFLPMAFVFLNIATVVLASVYERRNEIFTLASIGLNPTHIFSTFLSEAFLLGFIGGALGYLTSFTVFKGLQLSAAMVPVDVKSDFHSMLFIISLSTISSVVAGIIPSLKASAYATPSLTRRWRLEAEVASGVWKVEIPARVTEDKALQFTEFIVERLREEGYGIERVITDVSMHEKVEGGMQTYEIKFTYSKGGGQAFTAPSRLVIKPSNQEFYSVQLLVEPRSAYPKLYQRHVQEVSSFVRNVTLEWASLRVRLLVPVGTDPSSVVELIRHYNPQLVIIISRRGDPKIVREIRGRIRGLGLRPPAVELIDLKSKQIDELVIEVKNLISKADIIAIDSDDGVLSAIVALVAATEGRRVSVLKNGKVEETSVDKLLRPAA
ncbi:MAG: FtsX-like permease family protein [Thermofilaceae archaeon]